MKLPYPNRPQWCVIWASVLTAAHIWLNLDLRAWLPNSTGAWGLPAYLAPALDYRETPKLAVTVLAIGGFFIWQLSRPVSLQRIWIARAILASSLVAVSCVLWYVIASSRRPPDALDQLIQELPRDDVFDNIEAQRKKSEPPPLPLGYRTDNQKVRRPAGDDLQGWTIEGDTKTQERKGQK